MKNYLTVMGGLLLVLLNALFFLNSPFYGFLPSSDTHRFEVGLRTCFTLYEKVCYI